MKIKSFIVFLIIFSPFVSCSQKDKSNDPSNVYLRFLFRNSLGSALNSELPSSLSVAVPRSIRKADSSVSASLQKSRKPIGRNVDADALVANEISGLGALTRNTDIVAEILQESNRDLFLLSQIYERAKANPGVCIPGGSAELTIDSELEASFVESQVKLGLSQEDAILAVKNLQETGILPTVGQKVPTPAILYKVPTDTDYTHEVSFSFSDTLSSKRACPTNPIPRNFQKTLRWNQQKTKIYSEIRKVIQLFGTTIEINASITYETQPGKKDKAILNISQNTRIGKGGLIKAKNRFIMEECKAETTENTTNCVTLNLISENEAGENKIKVTVLGRTDNSGGYVKTSFKDGNNDWDLEEYFGPNKDLLWLKVTDASTGTILDTFGTLDVSLADDYGYGTTIGFDDAVTVELTTPANIGVDNGFTESDSFVLVLDGEDPSVSEDAILGFGFYFDEDGTGGDGELEISFFGSAEDVPNIRIWRETEDADGNIVYTLLPSERIIVQ